MKGWIAELVHETENGTMKRRRVHCTARWALEQNGDLDNLDQGKLTFAHGTGPYADVGRDLLIACETERWKNLVVNHRRQLPSAGVGSSHLALPALLAELPEDPSEYDPEHGYTTALRRFTPKRRGGSGSSTQRQWVLIGGMAQPYAHQDPRTWPLLAQWLNDHGQLLATNDGRAAVGSVTATAAAGIAKRLGPTGVWIGPEAPAGQAGSADDTVAMVAKMFRQSGGGIRGWGNSVTKLITISELVGP